ncbi:MAG: aminopeptidase [Gemmatimonadales bacterium]|jgi:CubicO group peptidase (beta-lactamase class C family)|nr:aminopeptidase [Gemmatimonadales bacterium]
MRRSWVLVLGLTLTLPGIVASQGSSGAADTTARVVDHVFDAWRGTDGPGCALGVSRNGHVVYEHGYGMANLETGTPIRPSSIFHVASVSKQFTAMAVMLLARDGKLSVDDNIRKYVPEIPDYGTPITIRHLLTHTSGLRDQWELIGLSRGRFEENRITEADVMDIVPRQKALNFTPGAEYVYSNTGFTLLAVIVKRVTGQSLREFADERIFRPLGMANTHFHDHYTMLVPGRTSAYKWGPSGWRVSIPNFDTYGATNLFTTVGDLLKWEANFDNPVVGDRALLDQMQTPARLTNGDPTGYGFGLAINQYRGARFVGHGGADAGYRSGVLRFPEHALAIAVLCNAATAAPWTLTVGVADAYIGGKLGPVEAQIMPKAVPLPIATLRSRAGVYVQPTTLEILELTVLNGQLILGHTSGPTLVPVAENRFRITEQPFELVFRAGEHAGFERQPLSGGRPVAFEWRQPTGASSSALAEYAGEYYSEEVDARYRVTASDSALLFRTGTSDPTRARPLFLNTFDWDGDYTVQFIRSGAQVTGFEVTNNQMRRVKFVRVPVPR